MKFLVQILISSLSVFMVAYVSPGVQVGSYGSAILVAIVLAFLNQVVKPVLTLLTIPITIVTLGFFLLALNAFMIMLAGALVPNFYVKGFWSALLFSLILSLITGVLTAMVGVRDDNQEKE